MDQDQPVNAPEAKSHQKQLEQRRRARCGCIHVIRFLGLSGSAPIV